MSRAVSSNVSISVADRCPVCLGTSVAGSGTGRDRLFGVAPGEFRLYRCNSCMCVFQYPLPGDSALRSFYPPTYWWSARTGDSPFERFWRGLEGSYRDLVIRDHVRFLLRCTRDLDSKRKALLDVGCGSGAFLNAAARHGFLPFGLDMSETAVAAAREQYGLDVRQGSVGSDVWEAATFDVITFFHVLEHLRDPRSALSYADSLLAPGGRLIIQVPNVDSLQAGIFGNRWYGLDVPRHLVNFSRQGLEILLSGAGFRVERISRFSLRDNPASIASSLAPALDPIGRKGRNRSRSAPVEAALEFVYLALFLGAIPLALGESAIGKGGTLWVCAQRE